MVLSSVLRAIYFSISYNTGCGWLSYGPTVFGFKLLRAISKMAR
jgi:hypothetical protein